MEFANELLSPGEVSKVLGVSKRTVLRWLEKGGIEGVKIGTKLIKIPKDSLKKIISPYSTAKNKKKETSPSRYIKDPFLNVDERLPLIGDAPKDLAQRYDFYLYGNYDIY